MVHTMARLVLVGTSLMAAPSRADVLELPLEELLQQPVVASAGYRTTVAEAPTTTTVITAEQWRAWGAASVFDVLRYVPGLHVRPGSSGLQLNTVVSRGLASDNNSEVLWLLDGTPVEQLAGNRPPAGFDKSLANLQRIEVIKGASSVIHGANAFSTVINLVSREAGGQALVGGARAGRPDGREAYGEWADQAGAWRWRLSADRRRQHGDPDRIVNRDLQSLLDARFGTQASLAPGPLPDGLDLDEVLARLEHGETALHAWYWRLGPEPRGMGIAEALDPERRNTTRYTSLRLQQRWPDAPRQTELQLEALYQEHDTDQYYQVFPPGSRLPIGADGAINFANPNTLTSFPDGVLGTVGNTSDRRALKLNLLNSAWTDHVLYASLGREWHRVDDVRHRANSGPGVLTGTETSQDGTLTELTGTPYSYLAPAQRHLSFLSVQDEWRPTARVRTYLGLRHDRYSDFGASTNPRVSLLWQAAPNHQLRLSHGSAFRAPSFQEQGLRHNPAIAGNPDLQPERLRTTEAAWTTLPAINLQLDLIAFRYRASRLITYAPQPGQPGLRRAENLSQRDGDGLEAVLHWQPTVTLNLSAAASVVDARDGDTGTKLPYTPRQQYTLTGWYRPWPHWTLGWAGKYVANRVREAADPRPAPKDHGQLDLNLRGQELLPGLAATLTVTNVTDHRSLEPTDPNLPDDLPLPGRAAWAGLEYRWR